MKRKPIGWHDICKDEEHQEEKMAYYYPDIHVPSWAIHGYLGAKWVKENLGIWDRDILKAIQRHALGKQGRTAYDYKFVHCSNTGGLIIFIFAFTASAISASSFSKTMISLGETPN